MFANMDILLVIIYGIIVLLCHVQCTSGDCKPNGLAKFNLTFEGHWSMEEFPKQYPLFRPNAQWSKLIGRSHSDNYTLFSIGSTASKALKEFSELGDTAVFDKQDQQGQNGILDLFQTTGIKQGVGAEWVTFFADEEHHLLSIASKIVPSPDWFVGGDSINLCSDKEWLTYTELELFPIDAGTDKGFTFTSPNWGERPLLPITQITSTFPSHPANSFYYPKKASLPVMAKLVIRKLEEFEIVEEDQAEEDSENADSDDSYSNENNGIKEEHITDYEEKHEPNQDKLIKDILEDVEGQEILNGVVDSDSNHEKTDVDNLVSEDLDLKSKQEKTTNEVTETTEEFVETTMSTTVSELTTPKVTTESVSEMTDISLTEHSEIQTGQDQPLDDESEIVIEEVIAPENVDHKTTTEPTDIPLNDFVRHQVLPTKKEQKQKRKNRKNRNRNGKRPKKHGHGQDTDILKEEKLNQEPVNCVLGEWGEWSACSVSCGYGRRNRIRVVLQQPKHGGRPCSQYPEEELCGTLRTCSQWKHFSFANWGIHLK